MSNAVVIVVGVLAGCALVLWLIVFPLRLSKGLLHKWGYHTHCGLGCEQNLEGARVQEMIDNAFRKGARQGMRGLETFGPQDSRKILKGMGLLPDLWPDEKVGTPVSPFVKEVRFKFRQIAGITDVTDNPNHWISAFAIASGYLLSKVEDPAAGFETAADLTRTFAGLAEAEQGE